MLSAFARSAAPARSEARWRFCEAFAASSAVFNFVSESTKSASAAVILLFIFSHDSSLACLEKSALRFVYAAAFSFSALAIATAKVIPGLFS